MFDFKLDFTATVPFRHCPDTNQAAALYLQCIANAPQDIEFRKVRPGIFNITVNSENEKSRLEGKKLAYDFGEKAHTLHTASIPLQLVKQKVFYNNPKWLTIDKLYDSALRYTQNDQIDKFLSNYGQVIVPTHNETDKFGFRTGRRKARVDIVKDIERWQEVSMVTTIEEKEVSAKGRVNIYYKGQPYDCRNCLEKHTEKCPQVIAKQLAEKETEKVRVANSQALLIGDSNLRRVNGKAFYSTTECASGAKIGHIANTLGYVQNDEHEMVIIHTGQNNILQEDSININEWTKQVQGEINSMKSKLSKFKHSVIVGVPPAPWCKKTTQTETMRTTINDSFKKVANDTPNIRYIHIEEEEGEEESNWEDVRHMTEKFTSHVLGKISDEVTKITGKTFFVPNINWTTNSKYQQVKSTYRLGCGICTKMGHSHENCPSISKKRQTCSGSESPKAKGKKK